MLSVTRGWLAWAIAVSLLVIGPRHAEARVVRFVVEQRDLFAAGMEWGKSGPYERLVGTAFMEVDPADPLNTVIVDLDKAPRNRRGMVEFSTTFFILKPVDMARGNQKIYHTANNRGNDALFTARTAGDVGTSDLYLRLGYTIVDAGWQGDLAPSPTRIAANLPIARQRDGRPIVGPMRVEYSDRNVPLTGAFTLNLEGSPAFRSYEAADIDPAHSTLTVRAEVDGPRTQIPADRWAFGRCPTGRASLVPSTFDICYADGFEPDKIYELIYPAKNPIVMGLGFAATRDVASFLRYEARDAAGNANPLRPTAGAAGIRRAYATGASQTGSYLRDFVYLGFNEDESHRKVFDGILPTIAGTLRVFINVRFADPNVYTRQDDAHDFLQSNYPPMTYGVTTDPISGIRDGILKRPATDPLVFQTDSATEFWQLRASLHVADGQGNPVAIPPGVRLYYNSSTGHGMTLTGFNTPPARTSPLCANPTPGGPIAETARALLVAMDAWADRGIEPPPSSYPRFEDGTLVPLDAARAAFPVLRGAPFPSVLNELALLDFGPEFGPRGGILTEQPPKLGGKYRQFVPKPDADGLDIAGIRPLQIRVPTGTTTGWNVRAPGHRAGHLCGLTGSFLPFAATRAERMATGDPRKSIEERYQDHAAFVGAVRSAAQQLVRQRFLLDEDATALVAAAQSSRVRK